MISIPIGSIKSILMIITIYINNISIPIGSIKSFLSLSSEETHPCISIPIGSIKSRKNYQQKYKLMTLKTIFQKK